jgi:prepilin-type N-terminal cleavage/methylation domain-containing protein
MAPGRAMIPPRAGLSQPGFTLVEILVAVMAAGLLTAMVAALLGRGMTASSALEDAAQGQQSRMVLARLLSMDLRNMLPDSELTLTANGFSLETSHNHLIPGPLPVTVEWRFEDEALIRLEEQTELEYAQQRSLLSNLRAWDMDLYDLEREQWVGLRSWPRDEDQPAPVGLRLRLRALGRTELVVVRRLPLHREPGL